MDTFRMRERLLQLLAYLSGVNNRMRCKSSWLASHVTSQAASLTPHILAHPHLTMFRLSEVCPDPCELRNTALPSKEDVTWSYGEYRCRPA